MAITYEKIQSTTLSSANSTITFSSIPATYTDLRLVVVPVGATGDLRIRFNSNTGSNYSNMYLAGTGTETNSGTYLNATSMILTNYNTMSSTVPDMRSLDLFSYAGSTYKTGLINEFVGRNGSGSIAIAVGLWRQTDAINRMDLFTVGTEFQSGTTATIYGIKAA
jgi:hypothetical protein